MVTAVNYALKYPVVHDAHVVRTAVVRIPPLNVGEAKFAYVYTVGELNTIPHDTISIPRPSSFESEAR